MDFVFPRWRTIGEEQVRFRFRSVALARFSAEEYVGASPLGAALSALMRRQKARKLELRREMLVRVLESELNRTLKYLLLNVIDTYLDRFVTANSLDEIGLGR